MEELLNLILCLWFNFGKTLTGKDRQKENGESIGERVVGADWKRNLMTVMCAIQNLKCELDHTGELMWKTEMKLENLKIVGGYKGAKTEEISKSENLDRYFFFVKQNLNERVIHFLLCDKGKVEKWINYLEEEMKITLYIC